MLSKSVLSFLILLNLVPNTIYASDNLEMCRSSFLNGRSITTVACKAETEHEPISYQIEEHFRDLARTQNNEESLSHLAQQVAIYGLPTLAFIAYKYKTSLRNDEVAPPQHALPNRTARLMMSVGSVIGLTFNSYTISQLITPDLQGFIQWAKKNAKNLLTRHWNQVSAQIGCTFCSILETDDANAWDMAVEIKAMRLQFESLRKTLAPQHQNQVDEFLTKLEKTYIQPTRATLQFESKYGSESERKTVTNYLYTIDSILSIPRDRLLINKAIAFPRVQKILEPYPENVRTKMLEISSGIEYASHADTFRSKKSRKIRQFLYFLGAPGTGKTHFARAYAAAMGLPLVEVLATKMKEQMVSQNRMEGRDTYQEPSLFIKELMRLPKQQRYKNAVIFIDEIDKAFASMDSHSYGGEADFRTFLLQLLDRDRESIFVKEFNIDLDVSDYIFIFAGNAPLAETGNALMNRMDTIDFGPISLESRLQIACHDFGGKTHDLEIGDQELQAIVDLSTLDNQKNIGIRSLLNTVGDYIQYLSLKTSPFAQNKTFDLAYQLDERSRSIWDPYSDFEILTRKFATIKTQLSPELRDLLTKEFKHIKYSYLPGISSSVRGEDASRKKAQEYFRNLETLMRLPQSTKNLMDKQGILLANLKELLSVYPSTVQDTVSTIAEAHIAASTEAETSKNVLYIYGKPGAGKTHLAHNLATALELPLIELSLAGASRKDILGSPVYGEEQLRDKLTITHLTAGILGQNSQVAPVKNAVFLIDEANKVINTKNNGDASELYDFLLRLTDPSKKTIRLNDLGLNVDISHYLFIIIGNERLHDPSTQPNTDGTYKDSPIDDRMQLLAFDGFDLESKKKVARKIFLEFTHEQHLSFDEATLSKHFDTVDQMVEFDHKDLGKTSLRALHKAISFYISHIKQSPEKEFEYQKRLKALSQKD